LLSLRHTISLALFGLALASFCRSNECLAQSQPGAAAQAASQTHPQTQNQNQPQTQNPSPSPPAAAAQSAAGKKNVGPPPAALPGLEQYRGMIVSAVEIRGVSATTLAPLPSQLPQQAGQPLDPAKVRQSLRRLYATGRFNTLEVQGQVENGKVRLIFTGRRTLFYRQIIVSGLKEDRLAATLVRASKLELGQPYSQPDVEKGIGFLERSLASNGYRQSKVTVTEQPDVATALIIINYHVDLGPQARVGDVTTTGDTGMSPQHFRKVAKLKYNSKVTQETTHSALSRLRKHYESQDRLEAKVTLDKQTYQLATNHVDYSFEVNRGLIVKVDVDGAKIRVAKIKSLVPVFQEGAVDEDLLNEGSRNLRDYFQGLGFFDATVTHMTQPAENGREVIAYTVVLGVRHHVSAVEISGNKYFDDATIRQRLQVLKSSPLIRFGRFSQTLVQNDVDAITNLYQANGFRDVKVTPQVTDVDKSGGQPMKLASLSVKYVVDEGPQSSFGAVNLVGVSPDRLADVQKLINAKPGQPYSIYTLSGDREAVLTYYLSAGYQNIQFEISQHPEKDAPQKIDVTMKTTEGEQFFINKIYISGLHFTRPDVVNSRLKIHAGDPLDQSAVIETQRRLYDLTLFNEVNTAVQDPDGEIPRKNVLINLQEAKRWNFTYGFGIQAQTGNPSQGCPSVATLIELGIDPATYHCSPAGKTGASGLVSFDATRINLFGRDETITLHTLYGSLEQVATAIFNNPHFYGHDNLSFSISGGYSNEQDVTTFASSALEGTVQLQQALDKSTSGRNVDTLIYRFSFRRVKVDPASIQVSADEIPLLSQPVRVGGPGGTYIRDTRDNPLNAHRGNYITLQTFLADSIFASQANFFRFDATAAGYYAFGKRRWVFARNTRYGAEKSYGGLGYETIPLPERLFAGGATSHRGFAINQAGPRDTQTGFPVGGAGAFVNSFELRTPNAQLPLVGNNLSFVFFHDMGNVFQYPYQVWTSFFQWSQPNRKSCENLAVAGGLCNFNYFSHAVGLGLRYNTPIGPIRVDLSYNINPPSYPVLVDPVRGPHASELPHFNFFFSLGQSF
jgi:outer membrane protein insertion porin family